MLSPHIYGPIKSRRLGLSLGLNILPNVGKVCNFDCAYCECGWNAETRTSEPFPSPKKILEELKAKVQDLTEQGASFQSLTFSGNGEPTLHPSFLEIVGQVWELRKSLFPKAKISVLTNGTTIREPRVQRALALVDTAIIKLDSAIDSTAKLIDSPPPGYTIDAQTQGLKKLSFPFTIQTMLLRGHINQTPVDNTSPEEVSRYLELIKEVRPASVMLYTIDRPTPCKTLQKCHLATLEAIARAVEALGVEVSVAG